MAKNNDNRKKKYDQLIKEGFSAKESAKLRDAKQNKIDDLIQAKRDALYSAQTEVFKERKASATDVRREKYNMARKAGFNSEQSRKLSKMNVEQFKQGLQKHNVPEVKKVGIQYSDIKEAPKGYLSKYTYKLSYNRYSRSDSGKFKKGEKEYLTITKMHKLSKKEVLEIARYILLQSGVSRYSPTDEISISSLKIEVAYENNELKEVI